MAGVFRHIPAQLSVEPVALLPAAMAAPLRSMAGWDTAVAVVLDTQAVLVAMAPMARFPVAVVAVVARLLMGSTAAQAVMVVMASSA